ncbi:MAG: dockerin type I repeat-containing protein [Ruminococcus sp.]|nr:dockerin type I repeat-containing protein [Ruminococcus sp.]
MKGKKISITLFAMCIMVNGVAYGRDNSSCRSITASAETIESGKFSEKFTWELDDAGILKISGSGEILDWTWVNDPRVYGHCRIKDVVIGEGIKKLGYVDYSPYGLENITILDPECIICETSDNADPTGSNYISDVRYGGVIFGYSGSTAQAYAEKHGFSFTEIQHTPVRIKGDVNGDGKLGISDVLLLQKWLLSVPDTELVDQKAADLCEDGKIDGFDLCLMKTELLEKDGRDD